MNPDPDTHVPVGQARLAAWCAGTGMPVVLLHAGVADSRMWRGQFDALAQTAQVVTYDRRGFGQTAAAAGAFAQVADLLAVLDALAPRRKALLVGCSQGGRIAIDTALAHPARVAGLVLIGTAVSGAPPIPLQQAADRLEAAIAAADRNGDVARVNALEAHLWLDGPTAPEGRVTGRLRDLFLDMNGIALAAPVLGQAAPPPAAYGRLAQIAVPSSVAWGNLDCADVIGWSRHIAAIVPGARRAVIPGTAHLPSLEAPAAVLALFEAALARG